MTKVQACAAQGARCGHRRALDGLPSLSPIARDDARGLGVDTDEECDAWIHGYEIGQAAGVNGEALDAQTQNAAFPAEYE